MASEHPLTQLERIDRLFENGGWRLVHQSPEHVEPLPDHPDHIRVVGGSFRMERIWRGHAHSSVGTSMSDVLDRTEREQRRIASLEDRPTRTHTGPSAL
jgi:hypothetical protein